MQQYIKSPSPPPPTLSPHPDPLRLRRSQKRGAGRRARQRARTSRRVAQGVRRVRGGCGAAAGWAATSTHVRGIPPTPRPGRRCRGRTRSGRRGSGAAIGGAGRVCWAGAGTSGGKPGRPRHGEGPGAALLLFDGVVSESAFKFMPMRVPSQSVRRAAIYPVQARLIRHRFPHPIRAPDHWMTQWLGSSWARAR